MNAFKPFIMLVMSLLLVMSVSALDHVTEKLLNGLESSEVSPFATTSSTVFHMEIDRYKPRHVMYTDGNALKTSDGNITETIAGHSSVTGYTEGVGEDARFNDIYGFTQISSTQVIASDNHNHCLREVDRVSRVTSLFAGRCQFRGYQDGASAIFSFPIAVIVDKRNSKQLLVADRGNGAVRTVHVDSKSVGTFVKSYQLEHMWYLAQDEITGDIYITEASISLYKLSYNTKSLNPIVGQINGRAPSNLYGVFMIETVILAADKTKNRILKYNMVHNTWSTLNACDVTKAHKNTDQCVIGSPTSILVTGNRLLIGDNNKITSYVLTCTDRNITVYTDTHTGTAKIELGEGYTIDLSEGTHTYETPGPFDQTCHITVNVINNLTEALTTSIPPTTTPCTDSNITVYANTHTGTARVELVEGYTIDLSVGTYTYETPGPFNQTCITVVIVINNLTEALTTSIPPTKTPCTDSNITVYTYTNTGTAKVRLVEGYTIDLSVGTYTYETPAPFNQTCITTVIVINNLTDAPTTSKACTMTPCTDSNIAVYTDTRTGTARVHLDVGYTINLSEGTYTYETPAPFNQTCITTVTVINKLKEAQTDPTTTVCNDRFDATTGLIAGNTVVLGIFIIISGVLGFVVIRIYRRNKRLSQDVDSPVYTSTQPTSAHGSGNQVDEHTYNCLELNDLSDNLEHKEQIKSRQPSYVEFLETVPGGDNNYENNNISS